MADPNQQNGTNFSHLYPINNLIDGYPANNAHYRPADVPVIAGGQHLSQDFLNRDAYDNFMIQGRAYQNGTHRSSRPASNGYSNGAPRYPPAQVLDPRGYMRAQQQQQPNGQAQYGSAMSPAPPQEFIFDSPSGSPAMNSNGNYNLGNSQSSYAPDGGMEAMMSRFHGISERSSQPPKRRKLDYGEDSSTKNKALMIGEVHSGGVLGNAMREYREQGINEAIANKQVAIDLTSDGEDDVVLVREFQHPSAQHGQIMRNYEEVCYGTVNGAKIHAHCVPTPPNKNRGSEHMWPSIPITVEPRKENCNTNYCRDPTGGTIGCLDQNTTMGLNLVRDHVLDLRTSAKILSRPRGSNDLPAGTRVSQHLDLDLTLYGPRHRAAEVGTMLSQKNVWLRTPILAERELVNPHRMLAHQIQRPANSSSSVYNSSSNGMRTVEEIRSDVNRVFDSMEKTDKLPLMEPDPRITTELLNHQKQGLYFMTNKEKERVYGKDEADNSSLWRLKIANSGSKSYYNVITGEEVRESPPQVLGGILADMMGLGKTLSIISLLVGSLDDSKKWAAQGPRAASNAPVKGSSVKHQPSEDSLMRVKSTLLVCPVSTISNWEDQIKQHVRPKSIKYYIYHGGNRCKDVNKLADYDLVITTYGSVGSEYGRREKNAEGVYPLQSVKWFRIVLDEAHMIREQITQQSKSICALEAQRRWAVTGTPVQNRLEDLGALLKFLRLKPFHEKGAFTQYILTPMKSADIDVIAKLRILVDSVTLRRLKDKIDLPKRVDRLDMLPFDEEERKLYDIFAKNANDRVQVMASGSGVKSFSHILHSITRLRLICAHGQSLLSDADMKITEGLSQSSAIDLDSEDEDADKPTLSSKEAYDIFNFMVETGADNCTSCNSKIGPKDEDSESDGRDETTGFIISCMSVLCNNCFKDYEPRAKSSSENRKDTYCDLCGQTHRISYIALKQNQIEEDDSARADAKDARGRKVKKVLCRYNGPHTKTKHLIQDLLKNGVESIPLVEKGEMPIKSVVFSTWTSHLDLIGIALDANGITWTRLDGSMSRGARSDAMNVFRDDKNVTVILVSISAGGMGLNLTAANKVYVMEPQFNPAAEAQAVDRVHRLGQKREVETVRYIMEHSFEEKMLALQAKKTKLANLSMDVGNKGKGMNKLGLEELRELFK